jgi:ABC-type arginine transport system ATPase subunit
LFPDRDALRAAVEALSDEDVARVSIDLPLRANLSAQENIALIPLYLGHLDAPTAAAQALALLDRLGQAPIAALRDPDLSPAQRFVAKLARALILGRPRLVIDRPGAMLYDVAYPQFLQQLAARCDAVPTWEIYDFDWNQALYPA